MPEELLSVDWESLVDHDGAVAADEPLGKVQERFASDAAGFLAVLDGDRPIGICSRDHVGMKLGSRYGFPLFAKAPVRDHLLPEPLFVRDDEALNDVLPRVFGRTGEAFGEDVLLVDEGGRYLGLIGVQTLVRLQSRLFLRSIDELEEKQADIDRRHRQMLEELRIARELQLALLPRSARTLPPGVPPESAEARVLSRYVPLEQVGGDFFEVVPISGHALGALIVDVSGHGVQAALVTAMLRGLVHEHAGSMTRPGDLLTAINASLHAILQDGRIASFATAYALVVDLDSGSLRHASAGHPSPLLLRRGEQGPVLLEEDPSSNEGVLGLLPDTRFPTREVPLCPGDAVVLYTDGLFEVEGPDGAHLGEAGLRRLVGSLGELRGEELLDGLLEGVRSFSKSGAFRDDVCLLTAEVRWTRPRFAPASRGSATL